MPFWMSGPRTARRRGDRRDAELGSLAYPPFGVEKGGTYGGANLGRPGAVVATQAFRQRRPDRSVDGAAEGPEAAEKV